jgi:hypothetical protein
MKAEYYHLIDVTIDDVLIGNRIIDHCHTQNVFLGHDRYYAAC